MRDDVLGEAANQKQTRLNAEAEIRRQQALDRAESELPQQVAGIPLVRFPSGTRPIPADVGPGTGVHPFAHVTGDLLRISPKVALERPAIDIVTPSDIREEMDMLGPGGGPSVIADLIETNYGKLQDRPSWANADQWARSGARWSEARSGGMNGQERQNEYLKSQHLMSPERAEYMQGPGRRADVLRGLRQDPERAMYFWDRSAPEEVRDGRPSERSLTRTDFHDPIYQRFGEDNVSPFMASSSPIARALTWMNSVPAASKFYAAESPNWSDAFGRSDVMVMAGDRTRSGAHQENPIADAPDNASAQQILDRQRELDARTAMLQNPPKENVANAIVKSVYDAIPHVSASAWADRPLKEGEDVKPPAPNASGLVRDAIDFVLNYGDASQGLGLLNPRAFASELFRDAGREAAIEVGMNAALGPTLPADPSAYVTEGVPSLPIDRDSRRAAYEDELQDMKSRPQSLWGARYRNDPVIFRPAARASAGVLDWLRSNTPSASAFGGQPAPR